MHFHKYWHYPVVHFVLWHIYLVVDQLFPVFIIHDYNACNRCIIINHEQCNDIHNYVQSNKFYYSTIEPHKFDYKPYSANV